MDVDGARVLVTGASSGIGAAAAEMLAARGATVGLVGRRTDRLDEVLARCRAHTPESRRWTCDLGDLDAAARLALEADDGLGGIDVLVNNAGAPMRRAATELTVAEVERTMGLNFHSPVRMTLALMPRMLERRQGIVVNVASIAGRLGVAKEAAYCASKFALCGWSEALFVDLAGTGVDVRLVQPGAIETEIWDQPDNDSPFYDGPKEPPAVVAEAIVTAIEQPVFELYAPATMKDVIELKTGDVDGFLGGMADEVRRAR